MLEDDIAATFTLDLTKKDNFELVKKLLLSYPETSVFEKNNSFQVNLDNGNNVTIQLSHTIKQNDNDHSFNLILEKTESTPEICVGQFILSNTDIDHDKTNIHFKNHIHAINVLDKPDDNGLFLLTSLFEQHPNADGFMEHNILTIEIEHTPIQIQLTHKLIKQEAKDKNFDGMIQPTGQFYVVGNKYEAGTYGVDSVIAKILYPLNNYTKLTWNKNFKKERLMKGILTVNAIVPDKPHLCLAKKELDLNKQVGLARTNQKIREVGNKRYMQFYKLISIDLLKYLYQHREKKIVNKVKNSNKIIPICSLSIAKNDAKSKNMAILYAFKNDVVDNNLIFFDLKPENILILNDGSARIIDYGEAQEVTFPNGTYTCDTSDIMGTTAYLAPESLKRMEREMELCEVTLDMKYDIFALGLVLQQLYYQFDDYILHIRKLKALPPKAIEMYEALEGKIPINDRPFYKFVSHFIDKMRSNNPKKRPSIVEAIIKMQAIILMDDKLQKYPNRNPEKLIKHYIKWLVLWDENDILTSVKYLLEKYNHHKENTIQDEQTQNLSFFYYKKAKKLSSMIYQQKKPFYKEVKDILKDINNPAISLDMIIIKLKELKGIMQKDNKANVYPLYDLLDFILIKIEPEGVLEEKNNLDFNI